MTFTPEDRIRMLRRLWELQRTGQPFEEFVKTRDDEFEALKEKAAAMTPEEHKVLAEKLQGYVKRRLH